MSPNGEKPLGAREMLLLASARAGLQENDPLYAVVTAQAELFESAMGSLALRSQPVQGIETANAEVKQLTEAVAMLEGQLKRIGEGINKLEIHCGNLDATLGTFAGIKKHQLWQLIAVSMGAGAIIIIGFQLLLDWLRPILHI